MYNYRMSFTKNELIAGKCWLDSNFPEIEELDITYVTLRFNMPQYAAEYVRKNWYENVFVIKPFKTSEIYSKTPPSSSSSSLYSDHSSSSSEV